MDSFETLNAKQPAWLIYALIEKPSQWQAAIMGGTIPTTYGVAPEAFLMS